MTRIAIVHKCLACIVFSLLVFISAPAYSAEVASLGIFESHDDVGSVNHPGSVVYSAEKGEYRVTGSGENMWFAVDAFHFVWKKVSGDFTFQSDIAFIGEGVNPHRKACLLIRQSLDPDSAYADAALHGDGLTSLQYRDAQGALTREIQANVKGPKTLRVTREGSSVFVSYLDESGKMVSAGGACMISFADPVYVGLGVCSHEADHSETAVFSNVKIAPLEKSAMQPRRESTLETIAIASKDRRVVYRAWNHFEAPNWLPDGNTLLFNSQGRIYTIPVTGGTPTPVETGFANRCNNDHGISPDGTRLVISDQSQTGKSLIYTLPLTGGTPKQITEQGPSYWHGWSPDGATLVYCAERGGEYDVYSIPAAGGQETRLTTAKGLDDGPEYSPEGKYIYFNSDRTGLMQIWRMNPDGSNQEQVTDDEFNNWFAHPSPDGKWIVFLSYENDVQGHPEDKNVQLRLMPVGGGEIQVLAKLFGGQGTINVPSWSPDSRNIAFVSYRLSALE